MENNNAGSKDSSSGSEFLNEHQRRHFEVFLEMFGKSLDEIERITSLPVDAPVGSLAVYDADLPGTFDDCAAPIVTALRVELGILAQSLRITPRRRSRSRMIGALATAEMVRVEDSFASKLSGYGSVDPRATAELDPRLESLREGLTSLIGCLHEHMHASAGREHQPGTQ